MAGRKMLIPAEGVCPDCDMVHFAGATGQAAKKAAAVKACASDWANWEEFGYNDLVIVGEDVINSKMNRAKPQKVSKLPKAKSTKLMIGGLKW